MKVLLIFIALTISFSSFSFKSDTIADSISANKNAVGGEILGYSLGIGFSYERLLVHRENLEIFIGLGMGYDVATFHHLSLPSYMEIEFTKRKLKPTLSTGMILGLGRDATFGYDDPLSFFNEECDGVPCAPWYPKTVLNFVIGAGLSWYPEEDLSITMSYQPSWLYNYYQVSTDSPTREFQHLVGVRVLKHF